MGARQKDWARRARLSLLEELGNRCARCGSTELLEFDCIIPTRDGHGSLDTSARMSYYRRQHAAGNLQILCFWCNRYKGPLIVRCDRCGVLLTEPLRIVNLCPAGCPEVLPPHPRKIVLHPF